MCRLLPLLLWDSQTGHQRVDVVVGLVVGHWEWRWRRWWWWWMTQRTSWVVRGFVLRRMSVVIHNVCRGGNCELRPVAVLIVVVAKSDGK